MAQVNIYAGPDGTTMQADIPDFALDATTERVAANTGLAADLLKAIASGQRLSKDAISKLGTVIQVEEQKTRAQDDRQHTETKRATADNRERLRDLQQATRQSGQRIRGGIDNLFSEQRSLNGTIAPLIAGVTGLASGLGDGFFARALDTLGTGVAVGTGFLLGSLDELTKQAQILASEVGGGLYTNMLALTGAAGQAGLFVSDLTKAAQQAGGTVARLGDNIDSGLIQFARFSDAFRGDVTRQFGNFGLNVGEINQLMLEEMQLMARRGASEEEMIRRLNSTNEGLGNLLYESTALARLTGRNRRDMIRAQMEVRNDAVSAARREDMTAEELAANEDALAAIVATLGPELGQQMAMAFDAEDVTGIPFFARLPEELQRAAQINATEFEDLKNAYLQGDQQGVIDSVLALQKSIDADRDMLLALATAGDPAADLLVNLRRDLNEFITNIDPDTPIAEQIARMLDADAQDNAQLGLTGETLQRIAAELAARATATGFNLVGGDPAAVGQFIQENLIGALDTLGIDLDESLLIEPEVDAPVTVNPEVSVNPDVSVNPEVSVNPNVTVPSDPEVRGFSATQIAALTALLVAGREGAAQLDNAANGRNNTGGGVGFTEIAAGTATGTAVGAAGSRLARLKSAAAATGRATVGIAGRALSFLGGPFGAGLVIVGGLVAAIAAAVDTSKTNTVKEDILDQQGEAVSNAVDNLNANFAGIFGEFGMQTNDVLNTAANMMREQGIEVADVNTSEMETILYDAFQELLKQNAQNAIRTVEFAGDNGESYIRMMQTSVDTLREVAAGERAFDPLIGAEATEFLNTILSDTADQATALQNILANPADFEPAVVEEANTRMRQLQAVEDSLMNMLGNEDIPQDFQNQIMNYVDQINQIQQPLLDQGIEFQASMLPTRTIMGLGEPEMLAQFDKLSRNFVNATITDEDLARAGITDENERNMLIALEDALERNTGGQIDAIDMALEAFGTSVTDLVSDQRLRESATSTEAMIELLKQIASATGVTSEAQVGLLEQGRIRDLRQNRDNNID